MQPKHAQDRQAGCSCVKDPFSSVQPDMRPRPRISSLRKVTCPGCGLVYSTNRETDLCMDCDKRR